MAYELEVDEEEVLEGGGDDGVSGAFTMPDLGVAVRTVTVEAEIRKSDKRKKIKRNLEYLGSDLPASAPQPPPASSALPAAPPPPAPPAAPVQAPKAVGGMSFAPAVRPRSNRRARKGPGRQVGEQLRQVAGSGERRRAHGGRERSRRSRVPGPRTAPLFDGVPERGAGARSDREGDLFALNAIAPRSAEIGATAALAGDGGSGTAVVVPALIGLAGLTLAGAALMRRRWLASRSQLD